jgi:hypothetical protein
MTSGMARAARVMPATTSTLTVARSIGRRPWKNGKRRFGVRSSAGGSVSALADPVVAMAGR